MQNMCLNGKLPIEVVNKHYIIKPNMKQYQLSMISEQTTSTQTAIDDTEGGINYDE
jgi:hypothetical protein